jgi:hypothetical protein
MMRHPLSAIPHGRRRLVFLPLLALTLLSMLVLAGLNRPLAPYGIVAFELAGEQQRAVEIVGAWGEAARLSAAFGLGFDYLYLVAYSTTIGLACLWAAEQLRDRGWPLAGIGMALAWAQWLAGLLDAVENATLFRVLLGPVEQPWPLIARWSAIFKFALVAIGLLYALAGALAWLTRRR